MKIRLGWIAVGFLSLSLFAFAQTPSNSNPPAASASTQVPRLIQFSGIAKDSNGKAMKSVVGITFFLYRDQQGGAPLWIETQNVQPDSSGHYTVLLGSTKSTGVPAEIFATGEAQWLGVQPEGVEEQPRVLIVSVPYALKALDAETIGGKPASAFLMAPISSTKANPATSSNSSGPPPLGGGGTTNFIARWTSATNLGNANIFQNGAGNIGIATTTPAANLDVNGSGSFRSTLRLFPSGVLPTFAVNGTTLSISSTGLVHFISGQTFPGTGTITKVSAGTDLTGGGSSGSVTLNLDTTKVPQLATANSFTGNQSVTGNISATGSISAATLSGNGAAVAGVNASLLNGIPSSSFALVTTSNTFPPDQFFNGNAGTMIVGDPGCGSGFAGVGFGALSGCVNYSLVGDGTNTYVNRPTGGKLYFRENNGTEMVIAPGGMVGIGTQTPATPLEVDASSVTPTDGAHFLGGSSGIGGYAGLVATGGDDTGFEDVGGSGGWFYGGASSTGVGGDGVNGFAGSGGQPGLAGYFGGDVSVTGTLSAGVKDFKIDHPLDPANKYFRHASVESSEMMNMYSGNVTLDANGAASVELPGWFEAVNTDFRYQLTAIGAAAPNLHIASEVANYQFNIAGGVPGMKVSWLVTGVRQDAFAKANPLVVEEPKDARLRGFYIHPELYGAPEEKQIEWARHPQMMKRLKDMRARQLAASQKQTVPRN